MWESEKWVYWRLPINASPQSSLVLFVHPVGSNLLKYKAWYTQWVGPAPTMQAFPYRKKVIKTSGKVFLEAPSNHFPLIKQVNFLQQFWKGGPKTRQCLLTQESRLWASVWWTRGGGVFQWRPRKQLRFSRKISGGLFWRCPHQVHHCWRNLYLLLLLWKLPNPLIENFSRKNFMIHAVYCYHSFVKRDPIL